MRATPLKRFQVHLTWKHEGYRPEPEAPLDCHENFIRPLLRICREAYVYRGGRGQPLPGCDLQTVIPARGRYRLNLAQEVVLGHEALWNSTAWKRGSILVLVDKPTPSDLRGLFRHSHSPSVCHNPNSGESSAAVRLALEEAGHGSLAVLFPASNGVEWVTLIPPPELYDEIAAEAERHCQRVDMEAWHAEWFETNPEGTG
jgi:hypothetical protein